MKYVQYKLVLMKELIKYFKESLGVEVEIIALNPERLKALPIFFKSEYNIYQVNLYHQDMLFAEVKGEFTTEKLRKHINIIRAAFFVMD